MGGQGRYGAATILLHGLIAGPDQILGALAASTLASHRRQLGGHAAARAHDALAYRRLAGHGVEFNVWARPRFRRRCGRCGTDRLLGQPSSPLSPHCAPAARSDVLLGLAADALGLGRIAEARRLADLARRGPDAGWRGRIRLGWVAA